MPPPPFFIFETRQRFTTVLFFSLFYFILFWHSNVFFFLIVAQESISADFHTVGSCWPQHGPTAGVQGFELAPASPESGHSEDAGPLSPCDQELMPICYLPWWLRSLTAIPASVSRPIMSLLCRKWSRSGQRMSHSFDCYDMDSWPLLRTQVCSKVTFWASCTFTLFHLILTIINYERAWTMSSKFNIFFKREHCKIVLTCFLIQWKKSIKETSPSTPLLSVSYYETKYPVASPFHDEVGNPLILPQPLILRPLHHRVLPAPLCYDFVASIS